MMAHVDPRASARPDFLARKRRALLVGCAVGAASIAVSRPEAALAQAFNATYTPATGNLTRTTGAGTETITVGPSGGPHNTAIINWGPNAEVTGATWNFLPQGNVATFESSSGSGFAVLNRVAIPVPIEFNGRVITQLQPESGVTRGGTVLFTNAAGIIVGPTAVFDVGNLVLSTLSVATNEVGYGDSFDPNDLSFSLGRGDPHATVETRSGARINAPAQGSFFAMVAPRVVHGGRAIVNGSTAYVAAEDVQLTIDNGLFDIVVSAGSDNPDPLTHTGDTGGPASTDAATDPHRIYMVAVPKNQAITALLSGDVGFDAATDVTVENGEIILSAGYNVFGDTVDTRNPPAGDPAPEANFFIPRGTVTSDLRGYASTTMGAGGGPANLTFEQDVSLFGAERARLTAAPGRTVSVGGDALVSSTAEVLDDSLEPITGGDARATANSGGRILVTGNLVVDASAYGQAAGYAVDATGGTARIEANGGEVRVGGDTVVAAVGIGGDNGSTGGTSGTGGNASVEASDGAEIYVTGVLHVNASGYGGYASTSGTAGGTGTGGNASLLADGATIQADIAVAAIGTGGTAYYDYYNYGLGVAISGGDGVGGTATLSVTGNGNLIFGDRQVLATGIGGYGAYGGAGGDGTGGSASIVVTGSGDSAFSVQVDASGIGGSGGAGVGSDGGGGPGGAGGAGGDGRAGMALVELTDNGVLSTSNTVLTAVGIGGDGGAGADGSLGGAGGSGGRGFGNSAAIRISDGAFDVAPGSGNLTVLAIGVGGTGGDGGDSSGVAGGAGGAGGAASAGGVDISASGDGVAANGTTLISASATGGDGGAGGAGSVSGALGAGGEGTAGTVQVSVADSLTGTGYMTLGAATVDASGFDGNSAAANGTAGRISFSDDTVQWRLEFRSLTATALGTPAAGGPAVQFSVTGLGPTIISGAIDVEADGDVAFIGTNSGRVQAGGAFTVSSGGTISLAHTNRLATASTISGASMTLDADVSVIGNAGSLITAVTGDARITAPLVDIGGVAAGANVDVDAGTIRIDFARSGANIDLDSTGDTVVDLANAGDDFLAAAGGSFTGGTVTANVGSDIIVTSVGDLTLDDATATRLIRLTSTGGSVLSGGLLDAGTILDIDAHADVRINEGVGKSGAFLTARDDIAVTSISGGDFVSVRAGGAADVEAAFSGEGHIGITALGGAAHVGNAGADLSVYVEGISIDADSLVAGTDLILVSRRNIRLGFGQAGDDFDASAGFTLSDRSNFTADSVIATGLGPDTEARDGGVPDGSNIVVRASRDIWLDDGRSAGAIKLVSLFGDIVSDTLLNARTDIDLFAARNNIAVAEANAGDDFLADAGGSFTGGTVTANVGSDIVINSGGDLTLDNGEATGLIQLTSSGGSVLSAGLLDAGTALTLNAAAAIDINDGEGGTAVDLSGVGLVDANDLVSGGHIFVGTSGGVTIASAESADFTRVLADGGVDMGTVEAGTSVLIEGGSIDVDSAIAGDDATLRSPGNIVVGFGQSGDDFRADAGGTFEGDEVIATGLGTDSEAGYGSTGDGSNIIVDSTGDLRLDIGEAAGAVLLTSREANIVSGERLEAGTDITLRAPAGNIDVAFAEAGDDFRAESGLGFTGDEVRTTGLGTDDEADDSSFGVGSNILITARDDLRLDGANAIDAVELHSFESDIFSDGLVIAGTSLRAIAPGDIDINDAEAGTFLYLSAGGGLDAGNLTAADSITGFASSGGMTITSTQSGGSTFLQASALADIGTMNAGTSLEVFAGSVEVASATAGHDVTLTAQVGDVIVGTAQAGDDFRARAEGAFAAGAVDTTGLGADNEAGFGPGTGEGSNIFVDAKGDIRLDDGDAADEMRLSSSGGDISSDLALAAGSSLEATTPGGIDVNDLTAGTTIFLQAGGALDAAAVNAGTTLSASAGLALNLASGQAGGSLSLHAGGPVTTGALGAGASIDVTGDGVAIASATAADDVSLNSGGDISIDLAEAGDDFRASAEGAFTATEVDATGEGIDGEAGQGSDAGEGSNILVDAGGDTRLDDGNAAGRIDLASMAGNIFSGAQLVAGTSVEAIAPGAIDLDDVTAGTSVFLQADGTLDAAAVAAGTSITAAAGPELTLASGEAGEFIFLQAGGPITTGALDAGTWISVFADGIQIASAVAGEDVTLGGDGDISIGFAEAGDDFRASTDGDFRGTQIAATGVGLDDEGGDGGNIVVDAGGDIRLDDGDSARDIDLESTGGNIFSDVQLAAGAIVRVNAAGDIDFHDVAGGTFVFLQAGGGLDAAAVVAGMSIQANAGLALTLESADSGESIFLQAGGSATAGSLDAGTSIDVIAEGIELVSAVAGTDMALVSGGDISVELAQAGDDFQATASGDFTGTTVRATGEGPDNDAGAGPESGEGSNIFVGTGGDIRVDDGSAASGIDLQSGGGDIRSDVRLLAGTHVQAGTSGGIDLNAVMAGSQVSLHAGQALVAGVVDAGTSMTASSGVEMTLASADAGGSISLQADGSLIAGPLDAGTNVDATAGDGIDLNGVTAGTSVFLQAGGALDAATVDAGTSITAIAGLGLTLASADAGGSISFQAGGPVSAGPLVAGTSIDVSGDGVDLASAVAGGDVTLDSGGDISVETAEAGDDFRATAEGAFTGPTVTATGEGPDSEAGYGSPSGDGSNILVDAGGGIRLDDGSAAGGIGLHSASGNVVSDVQLVAGTSVDATAAGRIDLNDVAAGTSVAMDAGGALDTAAVIAGNMISARSGLGLELASADAGGSILIEAGGPVSAGPLTAGASLDVAGEGLALATATAGHDLSLNSGGDISLSFAEAGDDFVASAEGAFDADVVRATGEGPDDEGGSSGGGDLLVDAGGDIRLGEGSAAGRVALESAVGNVISDVELVAETTLEATAAGNIDFNDAIAGSSVFLHAGGALDAAAVGAGTSITASAGLGLTLASGNAGGPIFLQAGGPLAAGALNAGASIDVTGEGIGVGSAIAGGDVSLRSGGDISVDLARAGDDFRASAEGTFTGGAIDATGAGTDSEAGYGSASGDGSNILVDAGGDVRLSEGNAAGGIGLESKGGGISSDTALLAGASVEATASGDIALNRVGAGDSILIEAGGGLNASLLTAGGGIVTQSGGATTVELGATSGDSIIVDAGGAAALGVVNAGEDLGVQGASIQVEFGSAGGAATLQSPGDVDVASGSAGTSFVVDAGGDVTAGSLAAEESVELSGRDIGVESANSGGTMFLSASGRIDAGTLDSGGAITIQSGANTAFDSVRSDGPVNVNAQGRIDGGNLSSEDSVTAEAGLALVIESVASEGGVDLEAGDELEIGTASAAGEMELTSRRGRIASHGALTARTLDAHAATDIALNDVAVTAALVLATPNGSISGNSFASDGGISLDASGPIDLGRAEAGADIDIVSGGAVSIDAATAGDSIALGAGGSLQAGILEAGSDAALTGVSIVVNAVTAGGAVSAASSGGLDVGSLGAGEGADLASGGDMNLGAATTGGDFIADAGGAFTGRSVTANGVSAITVDSSGDLRLDRAVAGGAMRLTSAEGDVLSGDQGSDSLGSLQAGEDLLATAGGGIAIGTAQAGGGITLQAGDDIVAGGLLSAGGDLGAIAGGGGRFAAVQAEAAAFDIGATAAFDGSVLAGTIAVTSFDIAIGASGGLGGPGTERVTLNALAGGGPVVFGGSDQGPAYTVDEAEVGRIVAETLRLEAPQTGNGANRPADLLVRNAALDASRIGRLEVATGGIVQVEGALRLANAGSTNAVAISAGERIQLINPIGSVRVLGASGLPGGTLTLESRNIWSASAALIAQLTADPNFSGRDAALTANDGPIEPRGYIEGADVELRASDTIFVQNSGTPAAFAGITVLENTLIVAPSGTSPLDVFAFGRRLNADGSAVTNEEFFREIQFQRDGAGFTDEAQFNLCFINTGVCGTELEDPTVPDGPDPIKEPLNRSFPRSDAPELVDTSFAADPLIEEPVTSGADSISWDCDEDDDRDCDREGGNE